MHDTPDQQLHATPNRLVGNKYLTDMHRIKKKNLPIGCQCLIKFKKAWQDFVFYIYKDI